MTACGTKFFSAESCQGFVYSGEKHSWITFFSMGYWMGRYQKMEQTLHLVEGNIHVDKLEPAAHKDELYFYGFATQNDQKELKLVDLASNKDTIGAPADTEILMYLYNAGSSLRNPKLRMPIFLPRDLELSRKLVRKEMLAIKERGICPFLEEEKTSD